MYNAIRFYIKVGNNIYSDDIICQNLDTKICGIHIILEKLERKT